MKILHIAKPHKFSIPFFRFVERHLDASQHVILTRRRKNSWPADMRITSHAVSGLRWMLAFARMAKDAEKIMLHGLLDFRVVLVLALQPQLLKKCYWFIWGGDLYRYNASSKGPGWHLKEAFRRPVIRQMGHLVTYIDGDVALARQWYGATGQHHECLLYPSNLYHAPAVPPAFHPDDLLALMPAHHREPVDMREVIARIVDGSELLEFKALYGAATLCVQARIEGHAVGIISNNGPIDVAGASKATHFIQWMCQLGHPIVYLQNTTGYMVGKDSEQGGMIKHGSKMIQAVTNATVPQITIQCGASFGAGNYGMCGRGYAPRFLFSWPNARTAVMGGEQAARTMRIVAEAGMARKGIPTDTPEVKAQMQAQFDQIVHVFESQADAFHTSGLVLDDGMIDPRDTRAVLAFCLDTCAEAAARELDRCVTDLGFVGALVLSLLLSMAFAGVLMQRMVKRHVHPEDGQ